MIYLTSNLWAIKSLARALSNSSLAAGLESRKSSTGSEIPRLFRIVLLFHAGEKGGQTVVIVLRPALERMVVALGALHANAEEELGGRFRQILRIARDAVKISRWVGKGASPGNQQIADDVIERGISFDLLAQPVLVDVCPLLLDRLAA